MHAAGLDHNGELIPDGKLHRFKAAGDRQKNSWYVLHPGSPAAGAFGCWKRGIKKKWCERNGQLSHAEWNEVHRRWQEAERERERTEKKRHEKARETAAWILEHSEPVAAHGYLTAKGVQLHGGLRQRGDLLVLPLRDTDGELHSLQFIAPDNRFDGERNKTFLGGGRVAGGCFTLADTPDGALVVCEGYATGASIHETTGLAVVCAMDCGNLLAVSKSLREKFPAREIIIAADNDCWKSEIGNPGLTKATEAAKAIGARLAVPQFKDVSSKTTDFNDLHQLQGADTVKTQIENATTPTEKDNEVFERLAKLSPADYDRCRDEEAKRLKIRVGTLDDEVLCRRQKEKPEGITDDPWPDAVDGAELLEHIAGTYKRFCVLPSHAADVLAVWILLTYCYLKFEFAAVIAVWSPEPECGKGRVLDVSEQIAYKAFRTANTSAPVLYHSVSNGDITVLIDELDSHNIEQREAIGNILKSGFQFNGKAHRMAERNGEQVVVEFSTYCPKMLATITLDTLDKATRTRSIGIRMQRKKREDKISKFRRYDGTEIRRKCMKWVADNLAALEAVGPLDLNECATDRQEDVWEPLVAIARVAGGDWEKRIRGAASHLSGRVNTAATEAIGHQLLSAMRDYFIANGNKAHTKTLIERLNASGDFSDLNRGRGLTAHFLAQHAITPRAELPHARRWSLAGHILATMAALIRWLAQDARLTGWTGGHSLDTESGYDTTLTQPQSLTQTDTHISTVSCPRIQNNACNHAGNDVVSLAGK